MSTHISFVCDLLMGLFLTGNHFRKDMGMQSLEASHLVLLVHASFFLHFLQLGIPPCKYLHFI